MSLSVIIIVSIYQSMILSTKSMTIFWFSHLSTRWQQHFSSMVFINPKLFIIIISIHQSVIHSTKSTTIFLICTSVHQVAAGMKAELRLELYAIAVGVEGESGVGTISHALEIVTETNILHVPIQANILADGHVGLIHFTCVILVLMSVFLECLSVWIMLNCTEQVQIQSYSIFVDGTYWVCFVAGVHPSRTWMSGSFESVWWNACVHRLDLGLYSHPEEFWGNGFRTHVNSKGKIPSTGSSMEDRTQNTASCRTASPTHCQLRCSSPKLNIKMWICTGLSAGQSQTANGILMISLLFHCHACFVIWWVWFHFTVCSVLNPK